MARHLTGEPHQQNEWYIRSKCGHANKIVVRDLLAEGASHNTMLGSIPHFVKPVSPASLSSKVAAEESKGGVLNAC